MSAAAKILSPSELSEGLRANVEFRVSAEQMQQFAELSGDFNPLHIDDAFARQKGFEGRVVYGALLIARISQLIGMELPGRNSVWASLNLDFKRPLYLGELAQVEGVVEQATDAGLVRLRLTLRSGSRVLAKGSAEVVVGR